MDYSHRLAISYYKTIAVINEAHKIYLVQHQESQKIYIKKILDVYNLQIYQYLQQKNYAGIPRIIDFCEENDQLILIEEYISGYSLQEKMETSDLSAASITHYVTELCDILEQLHASDPPIIHRDIKPSNIIITNYDHVVLLDFNASKHYTPGTDADTILLGTQGYAAPEQYGFGSSSPLTDIYTLGILLKELASTLPEIPANFSKIIKKCTEINPSDRFSSVCELKQVLMPPRHVDTPSFHRQFCILPGFRSKTPWKMILATITYLFIFWLCFTMEIKDTYGIALWTERTFCFLIILFVIFGSFNYLNIQRLIPLCGHKNRFLHYIGVLLLDFLLIFVFLTLLMVIELLFFV